MPETENPDNPFWNDGYIVMRGLIDPGQIAFVRAAMDASHNAGKMRLGKLNLERAMNEYAPLGGEAILLKCQAVFEEAIGKALTPSYALWRIYSTGAYLRPHIDREACEVSASLTIAGIPDAAAWPLIVRDFHGEEKTVPLNPGDAVVYQGCRVPHWRETFTGEKQYMLFLHYVLAEGSSAHLARDGRDSMSTDALID